MKYDVIIIGAGPGGLFAGSKRPFFLFCSMSEKGKKKDCNWDFCVL